MSLRCCTCLLLTCASALRLDSDALAALLEGGGSATIPSNSSCEPCRALSEPPAPTAVGRTPRGVDLFAVDAVTDPRLLFAGRDACSGCDLTVNLRCEGMRAGRYAPYHRVAECLLPMYGMVQLARAASGNRSARICALTWQDKHGMDLHVWLRDIVGIEWHTLVDEHDSCAGGLRYHAGYRTTMLGAKEAYLEQFGSDKNLVRAYSIDIEANLNWMQHDASAFVGRLWPLFIIIQRRNESRSFRAEALEQLKDSMRTVQLGRRSLPLTVYYGNEGVADTVRMFAQAAEVLGYHGAAWANTLFSARRHCMHQVSTFEDLREQKQWRINSEVKINRWGRLNVYNIALRRLLEDNKVGLADFEKAADKDHFIKDLDWVPLKGYDMTRLKISVRSCLKEWVEGHW